MANNTVAIILAGGKSERMGVAKGLLKFGKTFWILEQINRLGEAGIEEVVVALGYNFEHYFWAIDWFEPATIQPVKFMRVSVKVIINPQPELGSFSTLQFALKNIDSTQDVLLNPIDVPCAKTEELTKVLGSNSNVTLPTYKAKNGHPIKLKPSFWNRLINLDINSEQARLDIQIKSLKQSEISYISVEDSSIIKNLNTPSDWKQYINKN